MRTPIIASVLLAGAAGYGGEYYTLDLPSEVAEVPDAFESFDVREDKFARLAAGVIAFASRENAPESPEVTSPVASEIPVITIVQTPPRSDVEQPAGFNKEQFTIDDPASPWVIINKTRPLPLGYAPADLIVPNIPLSERRDAPNMQMNRQAAVAMEELFQAALADGIEYSFESGYRSAEYQKQLFEDAVRRKGREQAERYNAKPGLSEHQTSFAGDLVAESEKECSMKTCFGDTPAGDWLKRRAPEFGYIIRYPQGKESITGYGYEPWHIRFVGRELALEMQRTGILTMEEFFNLAPASSK